MKYFIIKIFNFTCFTVINILQAENKNEQRYYGFKTVENFPYKQNMSKSFFDMFSSSDDDSSPGEAEESSEEYFNPNAMYIGTYNDINNTYSDIDGPDSSEANFVINPLSDEVLASTPATKFHTNIFVPSLRSSVADVTRYCKESCSRATKRPCHKPFCIQKSLSTLWTTCESDCLSFFILFRGFLNELQM